MTRGAYPRSGSVGLVLLAVCWPLNWGLDGLRTHLLFFPLWLGYVLTVDGLTRMRTGTSLLSRSPRAFVLLFVISAPAWWLFELINLRTANWLYTGREAFSPLTYACFATLNFSTVMPAVFGTAELMRSCTFPGRLRPGPRIPDTPRSRTVMFMLGLLMLAGLLLRPEQCFPLVWLSVFFLVDPLNARKGRRSLLADLHRGDWRTVLSLALGCLVCGFFWEMWNYWSEPRWTYRIPLFDWWHVFEMPLPGYLGYVPFSWELFAIYHFVARESHQPCLLGEST